jgi:hypothetical protein
MCNTCYKKWLEVGKPDLPWDTRRPVDKFRDACKDGRVKADLDKGLRPLDLSLKWHVSQQSVYKCLKDVGILVANPRDTNKKLPREIELTPAQRIALTMPWVKNETPRYYLPV